MNIQAFVISNANDICSHTRKEKKLCSPLHWNSKCRVYLCTKTCTAGSSEITGMLQAICFICHHTERKEKNVLNMEFLLCLPDQRVLHGHIFLHIQNPYLDCRYKLIALKYLIKVTYVLDSDFWQEPRFLLYLFW